MQKKKSCVLTSTTLSETSRVLLYLQLVTFLFLSYR